MSGASVRARGRVGALVYGLDADPGIRFVFSGRSAAGGDANVALTVGAGGPVAAREDLLARAGASVDTAVFADQVHGAGVHVVARGDRGRGARDQGSALPRTDALVTADPGTAVCVLVADCVPVLLAVPGAAVAAVHAGRRGVIAGVVSAAVAALPEAEQPVALVGPAIGGCCYEVPADLAASVAESVPAAAARTTWGTPALDLRAAVTAQLLAAGVRQIGLVGGCTRCGPGHWFSHRAQPGAGRQLAAVVRHDSAAQLPAAEPPVFLDWPG